MRRRDFLGAIGIVTPLVLTGAAFAEDVTPSQRTAFDSPPFPEKGDAVKPAPRKGRIKQAVTRAVFQTAVPGQQAGAAPATGEMSFEEMCRQAARLGIHGFDLAGPADWPTLKKYGLVPSMWIVDGGGRGPSGPRITEAEAHDHFVQIYLDAIDTAARNGVPNIFLTTGPRGKVTDEQGQDALTAFLNSLKARAEDKSVTLCTELISSSKSVPLENRTMFDHGVWGFEVMKRVNSPRCKVLYDIFHAQVMDGNIVSTIRENWKWIGHFHTGGNPPVAGGGIRNELDDTQELYYPFIMKTIADLGFTDYVAHEYHPAPGMDPIASLEKCIRICDA